MAPLRLALLGLFASVHAANLPTSYWVSWDTDSTLPAPTEPSVISSEPVHTSPPVLSSKSSVVSSKPEYPWWPYPPKTTTTRTVLASKTSTKSSVVPPKTSTIPPSVSWDTGTGQPTQPTPTADPTNDPEDPPGPPATSNDISLDQPSASVTWYKRNEDDPEPTATPVEPADDPDFPGLPGWPSLPTPPSHITLLPPSYPVSWEKRQDEGLTGIIAPPLPTPPDEITLLPPTASVSWG